jgi:vitamin B12 transporter
VTTELSFQEDQYVHIILILAAAAASPPPSPPSEGEIIVTAAREPLGVADAPVSATLFGETTIQALSLPASTDLLRLSPGVSVATSGPRGSQAQVRIRGAEANHTLLFVDGIRFNDPAAGNEPRFELLMNDPLSRVELVRGPQSALWGSEALGGVVAAETADPFALPGFSALGEYGSLDTQRASAQAAGKFGNLGLSGSANWIRSDGIDSFGAGGELDGFENRSAHVKTVLRPTSIGEIGIVGHYVDGTSEYDGFDPTTFRRADTLDTTDNRIAALGGWARTEAAGFSFDLNGSYLHSRNRNRLAGDPLNSTFGERFTLGGQLSRTFGGQRLTAAVEHEGEAFRARDQVFFGGTDQDRSRELTAFIGEWHARWSDAFVTDVAVRHDRFSAFRDATTFRASALFRPAAQWTIHGSYGEGIAQPTFYDLFGFFPGSFAGNPRLKPEHSKGWEAGVKWTSGAASLGVAGFSNDLREEIVDVFDPVTFTSSTANATGKSRRRGIEAEGSYRFGALASVTLNYTYLESGERQTEGTALVREVRRPRHSANAVLTGEAGPLNWGASVAYVGKRQDTDFEQFPARRVTLDDYALASLRLGYRITSAIEAYGRVENAFDADYEDVLGYATAGRTIYAGLRLRFGS